MAAQAGHHPNRIYTDHNGDMHLNGASFFNDGEEDIAPALEGLGGLSEAQIDLLGVTAGTQAASKVQALDANLELDGLGAIQVADVLIPTGEVLALNATPKTIVAAPGAGNYLEFLGAYVFLDYNSAAYADDAGDDLVFKYTNGSGAAISNALDGSAFDGTADVLLFARPLNTAADTVEIVANAAIVLHLLNGEWVTGNSPLKIRCYYRVIRSASLEAIA